MRNKNNIIQWHTHELYKKKIYKSILGMSRATFDPSFIAKKLAHSLLSQFNTNIYMYKIYLKTNNWLSN